MEVDLRVRMTVREVLGYPGVNNRVNEIIRSEEFMKEYRLNVE